MGAVAAAGCAGAPSPEPVPRISVVVCTAGLRPCLWDLLDTLVGLDDPSFEVLVVENSAVPRLDAVRLRALGVRHVVEPRRGLDAARNRGLRESAGEVVAYVDDDCLVHVGWLAGLRDAFADPTVDLVTGRVLPASLELATERWFDRHFPWDRGVVRKRFGDHDPLPWYPASMHHLGTGCNMAFRRSALEALGGFDEALDMGTMVGGGGDMDAFGRAVDAGMVAVYEPRALVLHRHRATREDLRWQVWGYGVSQGALAAKGVVTRRGVRLQVARLWLWRTRSRWADARRELRCGGAELRSATLLEAAGLTVGPLLYAPSAVSAWLRRRRT